MNFTFNHEFHIQPWITHSTLIFTYFWLWISHSTMNSTMHRQYRTLHRWYGTQQFQPFVLPQRGGLVILHVWFIRKSLLSWFTAKGFLINQTLFSSYYYYLCLFYISISNTWWCTLLQPMVYLYTKGIEIKLFISWLRLLLHAWRWCQRYTSAKSWILMMLFKRRKQWCDLYCTNLKYVFTCTDITRQFHDRFL